MLFDVLIVSICTFVILAKTENIWLTSGVFAGSYAVTKILGNNPLIALLKYTGGLFIYGILIFFLLKKFREEDNTVAFIVVFCLSTLLKGLTIGWG